MRLSFARFVTLAQVALMFGLAPSALAENSGTAKLKVSAGERFIPEAAQSAPLPIEELKKEDEGAPAKPSAPRGGKTTSLKSRLPDGVPLSKPNAKARASVAEGPTSEEITEGAKDEQLDALRAAEKVLFAEPIRGIRTSWTFDVPEPQGEEGRRLGLPFTLGPSVAHEGASDEDLAWLKSLTMPDLPIQLDRRVITYLKFYRDSHRGRTIAAIWTKKSGRYVTEIKAKLRRAGLPTDLVWLSMIESGHDPTIKSPAGAAGLWQFIPESARMYGLTVDRSVDERQDPARSTQAAIRFLDDLYRRFGNWELAMGAYNMGYSGMSRAVAKYNTNDYWALSRLESGIPWETTLYVPKIFALAIVMNNREAFGVGRTPIDPAESFDTILLEPATSLKDAAKAAGIAFEELKALNPQYLTERLPANSPSSASKWPVQLPRGTSTAALLKLKGGTGSLATHRVRMGDTAETLANDYGVSASALEKENGLLPEELLSSGTILVLPKNANLVKDTTPVDVVVSRLLKPAAGEHAVYYQVRDRDELAEVSAAFGVTESDLARWNRLSTSAHLRSGMTLQVIVKKTVKLDDVRHIEPHRARVFLAGSSEFHEHFEGLGGKRRVVVTAGPRDTLSGIGSRFGMSVGSMERINRRSRSTKLVPGERLIVYTNQTVASASTDEKPEALPEIQAPYPELLPAAAGSGD